MGCGTPVFTDTAGGGDGERQRERLCLPQPSFNYSADI